MSLRERAEIGGHVAAAAGTTVAPLLVPVDLSPRAEEMLKHAARMAERLGCTAEVLHVVQLNICGEERGIPRGRLLHGLAQEAQSVLCKLVERCWGSEAGATVRVRDGCPHRVIVEEARETRACMIVMGGSRPRFWRFPGTSTCARVLKEAPCPVMTVGRCEEGVFFFFFLRPRGFDAAQARFSFV